MKHEVIISVFIIITCAACASAAPISTVSGTQLSEICGEWLDERFMLGCRQAVIRFEEELADHLQCTADVECIADRIAPIPGYCCYASRRDWWESTEKRELLSNAGVMCGRICILDCPKQCQAACLEGRCTLVFDVEPSKRETIDK